MCYEITVQDIDEPVEPAPGLGSAHIHFVATGGIAVDLKADFQPTADGFRASGCVEDVDRRLLNDIIRNPEDYYLNIHNVPHPGGALFAPLG